MLSILAWVKSLFMKIVNRIAGWFGQKPPFDVPEEEDDPFGPVVAYYGCPNSKRTETLQLGRKRYK